MSTDLGAAEDANRATALTHPRKSLRALSLLGIAIAVVAYVLGIILGAAAYRPGTSIVFGKPIRWALLPTEVDRVPWSLIARSCPLLLSALFAACVIAAGAVCLRPRLLVRRSMRIGFLAMAAIGVFPAVSGAISTLFTVLNAFTPPGLDGEWLDEFHPAIEAFFIVYLFLCVCMFAEWLRQRAADLCVHTE